MSIPLISYLRPRRNFIATVVSTLISGVGTLATVVFALAQSLPGWVPITLAVVTLLGLVLAVLALVVPPRTPTPRTNYLPDKDARSMLQAAIHPRLAPICASDPVGHQTGAAILGYAAQNCWGGVKDIIDILDNLAGEFRDESRFTTESVVEHLSLTAGVQSRVAALCSAMSTKHCVTLMPEARQTLQFLVEAARGIEETALVPLTDLLQEVAPGSDWDVEHPVHAVRIEEVLTRTVPSALDALRRRAGALEVRLHIGRGFNALQTDWHSDILCIWSDDLCSPTCPKVPGR